MHRPGIALLVVLGSLAMPGAAPAQAPLLTPPQFAAIDAVYVAFAPFQDGATSAERVAARAACTALGSADALRSTLRRACFAQLSIGQALGQSERCKGRRPCLLGARAVRRALTDYLAFSRAANRAVVELGLTSACSRELRRSAGELLYITRMRSLFVQLERALRVGSRRLADSAQRRLKALRAPDSRSVEQTREDFRAGCAPPG